MIIFAIDQSTNISGFSIWRDSELLEYGKVKFEGDFIDRIASLRDWILEKLSQYEEEKIEVVLEEIQQQLNVETFKKLAMLQGALLLTLKDNRIKTHLIYSSQWKSRARIDGKSRAEQKRSAQQHVLNLYKIKASQDEADAICLGEYIAKGRINWD